MNFSSTSDSLSSHGRKMIVAPCTQQCSPVIVDCQIRTRCKCCLCMTHRWRQHEEAGLNRREKYLPRRARRALSGVDNRRKTFCSYGAISLRDGVEYNSSLPDHHARHCAFCRRRAEAVGTHHGVLEIPTIDAASCQAHAACSLSQVIEGFADEQSFAALTVHTPPFYFICRS